MAPHLQDGPLRFHPLAFLEDGGEVVVGRSDIDSYGVFPVDGAALVRELAAGRPPGDAADWYADTYGERIDMADFVATLLELQLVRSESEPLVATTAPVRGQRLGCALFSPPAWGLYFLLLAAAVLVCVLDDAMLPRTDNVFFTGSLVIVAVAVFAGQLALTLWHEAFHVLAGRRLGMRSRVRISRRLYFVVFETNLDGLAVVERRRRYLPILAGLLADALAVAGLTVLAYLTRDWPVVSGLCLALAFTTLPRMAWQFYLFLRTDIYHLIATATGCVDLDTAARALIANRVNGLLGRRRPPARRASVRRARPPARALVRAAAGRRLRVDADRARAGARPAAAALLGVRPPGRPDPLPAGRRAGARAARTARRPKEDDMTRHRWISAPSADPDLPLLARIDAHRRLRGPYTAAGSLVRALEFDPALLARHDVEVLTVAPELRGTVTSTRETLTSLAPPDERTRFYPPARTQRIAHGLAELLRDTVATGPRRALVIERADEADPTDVEWIATLLRRIDPARLQIVVCAGEDGSLTNALRRYADRGAGVERAQSPLPTTSPPTAPMVGCAPPTTRWTPTSGRRCTMPARTNWRPAASSRSRSARSRTTASAAAIRTVPAHVRCSPRSSTACWRATTTRCLTSRTARTRCWTGPSSPRSAGASPPS